MRKNLLKYMIPTMLSLTTTVECANTSLDATTNYVILAEQQAKTIQDVQNGQEKISNTFFNQKASTFLAAVSIIGSLLAAISNIINYITLSEGYKDGYGVIIMCITSLISIFLEWWTRNRSISFAMKHIANTIANIIFTFWEMILAICIIIGSETYTQNIDIIEKGEMIKNPAMFFSASTLEKNTYTLLQIIGLFISVIATFLKIILGVAMENKE